MDKKDWHPCTCQIMHHFSQKIVAMTNALVFTCLFLLFALEQHKKSEKKCQIWLDSTQNSKNGLDKMIGTLNLIFGSTPFGKNNWNQSLPVTMNECLTTLYWNFGPLFFCQLLQVSHIWRVPSPNCCFEIIRYHRLSARSQGLLTHDQTEPRAWHHSLKQAGFLCYLRLFHF